MLLSGNRIEDIQERLKALGLYQYFFPSPDQIALGVTDRTPATTLNTISSAIELSPALGHPLGPAELVSGPAAVSKVIEELQDQGLLVEGEYGFEVTEKGATARATVKFRPREGLVSKLIQRLNVKVDISAKDLIPR